MSMTEKIRRASRSRVTALIGIGSILDLRGGATYRNFAALTQANRRKTSVKASFSTAMRRRPH